MDCLSTAADAAHPGCGGRCQLAGIRRHTAGPGPRRRLRRRGARSRARHHALAGAVALSSAGCVWHPRLPFLVGAQGHAGLLRRISHVFVRTVCSKRCSCVPAGSFGATSFTHRPWRGWRGGYGCQPVAKLSMPADLLWQLWKQFSNAAPQLVSSCCFIVKSKVPLQGFLVSQIFRHMKASNRTAI